MTGAAILILLGAMASGWALRRLLLKTLRIRYPRELEALGNPSHRQLSSLMPRNQEVQLRFWKYLWGGKVFLLNDNRVSSLARGALISDAALVGSIVLLFWSAGK